MAKDNDKGMYLPLKIDINEWEKSLLEADADLQKEMRKMRAAVSDLKLRYEVEIANAKVAGDELKAIELENEKLNAIYDAQKQEVEALSRAYQKSVEEKGADAGASVALANALVKETRALERTKSQINARIEAEKKLRENELIAAQKAEEEKLRIAQKAEEERLKIAKKAAEEKAKAEAKAAEERAKAEAKATVEAEKAAKEVENARNKIINGTIGMFSPKLAAAKQALEGLSSSFRVVSKDAAAAFASMSASAGIAVSALTGVGVALGGIYVAYKGAKAVSDNMREMGEKAANASESVFMLAERLNLSYKEAEKLDAIFTLDGSSAEGFVNSVQKLNKQLITAGEDGNTASNMLKRYNVELRNADGTQKNYVEQLQALADGYQKAKAAGEDLDFVTATLGSAGNQYVHLLNGLDDYVKKTNELVRAKEVDYELNHDLLTVNNQILLQQKEMEKASGGVYGDSALEAKRKELAFLRMRTELMNENKEMYKEFANDLKFLNDFVIRIEGNLSIYFDKLKAGFASVAVEIAKVFGIKAELPQSKSLDEKLAEMQKNNASKTTTKQQNSELDKKTEQEAKKLKDARERFEKELRDATSTEYEKQINALNDKRQQYIDEQISEVEANRLYTLQKQQIDDAYYAKLKKEKETQAKQAEDLIKKELEMQKRAREEAISGAEGTLRSNLKLIRYIQKQRNAGTYNEADAKAYADRLYMRQNGFKNSDISALKEIGVGVVQEIANARDRLFGQFANVNPLETAQPVTNNNNVTINFDNTVLDNVSAMDLLANKVAAIIQPAIQRAMQGQTGGSYGYTN